MIYTMTVILIKSRFIIVYIIRKLLKINYLRTCLAYFHACFPQVLLLIFLIITSDGNKVYTREDLKQVLGSKEKVSDFMKYFIVRFEQL